MNKTRLAKKKLAAKKAAEPKPKPEPTPAPAPEPTPDPKDAA